MGGLSGYAQDKALKAFLRGEIGIDTPLPSSPPSGSLTSRPSQWFHPSASFQDGAKNIARQPKGRFLVVLRVAAVKTYRGSLRLVGHSPINRPCKKPEILHHLRNPGEMDFVYPQYVVLCSDNSRNWRFWMLNPAARCREFGVPVCHDEFQFRRMLTPYVSTPLCFFFRVQRGVRFWFGGINPLLEGRLKPAPAKKQVG